MKLPKTTKRNVKANAARVLNAAEITDVSNKILAALALDYSALTERTVIGLCDQIENGFLDGLALNVLAIEIFSVFTEEKILRPGDLKQGEIYQVLLTV